ncbi:uncharacterized protein LOC111408140 [Olea europaea var. sylvestris]|uniref:uncharacterized protein LOC111408140 n=1 Tax=Olea europaea var. sylvestris TaxID=158386 RepID=UPI000C1D4926|nr:uncharacterized protein LOC111408140 [Olea europaea var. sylvestris]
MTIDDKYYNRTTSNAMARRNILADDQLALPAKLSARARTKLVVTFDEAYYYKLVPSKIAIPVEDLCEEKPLIFLPFRHHQRNRAGRFTFFRLGQTVSFYSYRVLHTCLGLYRDVVINATPHNSPYEKENVQPWYSFFQDVVGAIDGTHIASYVSLEEQGKYHNRKQVFSQNVLVACTFDMKFTYVLAGWEGSVHDVRLLLSAILCQGHKLTIHVGKYYLVDVVFPSVSSFLAPYRRTHYYRRDIEGQRPESSKEFAYLRHQSYHDIDTQAKIVLVCSAIHNFLRIDDVEDVCEDDDVDNSDDEVNPTHVDIPEDETPNAHISFTNQEVWSNKRNAIADLMWADYLPNQNAGIDFD